MGKSTHLHASRKNFPHHRFNWVSPDRTQLRCDLMLMYDQIDDELRRERTDKKKKAKREVKVLLLCQSESGKSTVLKNFRLKYATQWKAKLGFWRTVIQLNLIQNVLTILDLMHGRTAASSPSTPCERKRRPAEPVRHRLDVLGPLCRHCRCTRSPADIVLTQKHHLLHLRLSPLREVSDDLHRPRVHLRQRRRQRAERRSRPVLPHVQVPAHEFGVCSWISALGLQSGGGTKKSNEPMPD
ncbi:G-protein alpha subunit-domain-containing protein [Mycena olivaceomarginata]|nr:G-protein alpha subunit-domain-containing protein [Mycena olivaceomarginata]